MSVRLRTRWRYWRRTGIKLGRLAKILGTTVREVDGRLWITETGWPHEPELDVPEHLGGAGGDPPPTPEELLRQIELANDLRTWFSSPPTIEVSTFYEYRDES